jgi:hypothetical protein
MMCADVFYSCIGEGPAYLKKSNSHTLPRRSALIGLRDKFSQGCQSRDKRRTVQFSTDASDRQQVCCSANTFRQIYVSTPHPDPP